MTHITGYRCLCVIIFHGQHSTNAGYAGNAGSTNSFGGMTAEGWQNWIRNQIEASGTGDVFIRNPFNVDTPLPGPTGSIWACVTQSSDGWTPIFTTEGLKTINESTGLRNLISIFAIRIQ